MHKPRLPVSWSSKGRAHAGLTLIELLVTLAILSILAAAALPYAELTVRRDKELELSRSLREVRSAIDGFHEDWLAGRITRNTSAASADGYPKTLQVLVDGVDTGRAGGGKRRYLRSVPHNPLVDVADTQWLLRGYQDEPDVLSWNGRDVYDIHAATDKPAIDGSTYRDW
jgi:general secretion pathway protein G